ncbi:putative WD repeat-containing protein [Diplonema papillatum]|nr:putative WD repeat-containing protein [Diplonema papillatum]
MKRLHATRTFFLLRSVAHQQTLDVMPSGGPDTRGHANTDLKEKDDQADTALPASPRASTVVVRRFSADRVTKLYNSNRLFTFYEEATEEERDVLWELLKGCKMVAYPAPGPRAAAPAAPEAPRPRGKPQKLGALSLLNTVDCDNYEPGCGGAASPPPQPPAAAKAGFQVIVGGDAGVYKFDLTSEERELLGSAPEVEDGLDLGGLNAMSLIRNRWKPTRVKNFRVRTFVGHGRTIRVIGLSPDNRMVVSGDGVEGKQLLLRCASPSTGQYVGSLNNRSGSGDAPCDMSFSTNGQLLATCDQSDTILLWDMTSFRCKKSIQFESAEGTELFVVGVRLSPDGRLVVAAAEQSSDEGVNQGRVVVWDLAQKKQKLVFTEHAATVLCVAVSPNSEKVLSGGRDGMLFAWRIEDGAVLHRLTTHPSGIRSCAFSYCGRMMLSADAKVFALWSVESGGCLFSRHIDGTVMQGVVVPTMPSPHTDRVFKLRFTTALFTPSGLVLLASSDRVVRFLYPHTREEAFSFISRAPVSCSSSGQSRVAIGDMFGNVYAVEMDLAPTDQPYPLPVMVDCDADADSDTETDGGQPSTPGSESEVASDPRALPTDSPVPVG